MKALNVAKFHPTSTTFRLVIDDLGLSGLSKTIGNIENEATCSALCLEGAGKHFWTSWFVFKQDNIWNCKCTILIAANICGSCLGQETSITKDIGTAMYIKNAPATVDQKCLTCHGISIRPITFC